MTIKTLTTAAALIAGTIGFAGKADAQVIYSSGGTYYSTPGVVYSSGYTPGVVYSSPVVYSSGYTYPAYSSNYYYPSTSYYGNTWGSPYTGFSGVTGFNNIYGNPWGTGLNIGTRGATWNGMRLWRR
jgi:hypothetical protein